jgi:hypothetical protein
MMHLPITQMIDQTSGMVVEKKNKNSTNVYKEKPKAKWLGLGIKIL